MFDISKAKGSYLLSFLCSGVAWTFILRFTWNPPSLFPLLYFALPPFFSLNNANVVLYFISPRFLSQSVFSSSQNHRMAEWTLCFSLSPLPLVLSLGTTKKSLALSSLHLSFRYSWTLIRCCQTLFFLQIEQAQLFQPFFIGEVLQLWPSLWPLLDIPQQFHVLCWWPQTWMQ